MKVPPAKSAQAVIAAMEYFAQVRSTEVFRPVQLARFRWLLDGPRPVQLPHTPNSAAVCCWRTSLPLLSPCAIPRHPLGWFINIGVVVLAGVHEASSPHVQTPSLL